MQRIAPSKKSVDDKQQSAPGMDCRVCEAPARFTHYGVVTCSSCKVFFKRKAEQGLEVLKCDWDGRCEVTIYTRHLCTHCRLQKCFTSGMLKEKLRPSVVQIRKVKKKKQTTLLRSNPSAQFPTVNLLTADQSAMLIEQWHLLPDLLRCYDEYSGLTIGEEYVREQHRLPLQLRFASTSLVNVLQTILKRTQKLYQNNPDFRSLSAEDRSILVQTTMIYTSTLSTSFITHKVRLMNSPTYFDALGRISHPSFISVAQRLALRLDFDMTVMKLFLAILSFSTMHFPSHSGTTPMNLSNIKQILDVQNTYVDLLWRYLVYQHNHQLAVRCFSDLNRCLFAVNDCVVETLEVQWLMETVDGMIAETKEILNLNN